VLGDSLLSALQGARSLPVERNAARRQVIWEDLLPKLPLGPGVLYILSEDLSFRSWRYVFAAYDLEGGRGAVSVARMRSEDENPACSSLDPRLRPLSV